MSLYGRRNKERRKERLQGNVNVQTLPFFRIGNVMNARECRTKISVQLLFCVIGVGKSVAMMLLTSVQRYGENEFCRTLIKTE